MSCCWIPSKLRNVNGGCSSSHLHHTFTVHTTHSLRCIVKPKQNLKPKNRHSIHGGMHSMKMNSTVSNQVQLRQCPLSLLLFLSDNQFWIHCKGAPSKRCVVVMNHNHDWLHNVIQLHRQEAFRLIPQDRSRFYSTPTPGYCRYFI